LFSNINTLLLKPISATKKVGFVWKSGIFNHVKRKSQEKNKKKSIQGIGSSTDFRRGKNEPIALNWIFHQIVT
jgi:hypothetical protein